MMITRNSPFPCIVPRGTVFMHYTCIVSRGTLFRNVVKLGYTIDSKSIRAVLYAGSIPAIPTIKEGETMKKETIIVKRNEIYNNF